MGGGAVAFFVAGGVGFEGVGAFTAVLQGQADEGAFDVGEAGFEVGEFFCTQDDGGQAVQRRDGFDFLEDSGGEFGISEFAAEIGGRWRMGDEDFYVNVELIGLAGYVSALLLLRAGDEDEFSFVGAGGVEVVVFADAGDAEVCGGEFG